MARRLWPAGRRPGFFEEAQSALERAGFRRPTHLTAREYSQQVSARSPKLSSILRLCELHYAERFGRRPLDAEESSTARRLLRELKAQL
ncbi:MAG: DUF4129 domain-containing protein [Elusimicrobia bacterium]|nr:DUF4129 domain-containing protein [Elusimicrobiota bacterium]